MYLMKTSRQEWHITKWENSCRPNTYLSHAACHKDFFEQKTKQLCLIIGCADWHVSAGQIGLVTIQCLLVATYTGANCVLSMKARQYSFNSAWTDKLQELTRLYVESAKTHAIPWGFEPLRATPNGFRAHLLSHLCDVLIAFLKLDGGQVYGDLVWFPTAILLHEIANTINVLYKAWKGLLVLAKFTLDRCLQRPANVMPIKMYSRTFVHLQKMYHFLHK